MQHKAGEAGVGIRRAISKSYELRGEHRIELRWIEERGRRVQNLARVLVDLQDEVVRKLMASGYEADIAQAVGEFISLEVSNIIRGELSKISRGEESRV